MKKYILILLLIVLLIPLLNSSEFFAYADDGEKQLENEIDKGLDDLIPSELEQFFNGLNDSAKSKIGGGMRTLIDKIIKGESVGPDIFLELIWGAVKENILSILTSLITIVALAILFSLSKNLSSGFIKESTSQIVYYVIYGSIIAILCVMINSVIMSAKEVISGVSTLIEIAFPILLTLLTALGATASVAAYQPLLLIFTKVVVNIIEYAVMPMFIATIVFTIIGNLTNNIKLEKLTKAIGSIAKWVLGIVFGLIITLITAQGIVGASIDTVSIRSAKFALSSYVPILGGYLSEGFDIIMASAIVIKNALGLAAVLILFIIILAPIAKIVIMSLLLKLTAGIIEPMADSRISNLLYSTAKNLNILISITLGITFLAFVMFMLVIYTFNMGAL